MRENNEILQGWRMEHVLWCIVFAVCIFSAVYVENVEDAGGDCKCGRRVCHCACRV